MHRGSLVCGLQLNRVWNNLISVTLINWNLSCASFFPRSSSNRAYARFFHPVPFVRIIYKWAKKSHWTRKSPGCSRLQPVDGRWWRQTATTTTTTSSSVQCHHIVSLWYYTHGTPNWFLLSNNFRLSGQAGSVDYFPSSNARSSRGVELLIRTISAHTQKLRPRFVGELSADCI